jgi:hypothetical protein
MECGDNSVLSFGDKNLIIVAITPPKQKLPNVELLPLTGIVGDPPPFAWDFQPERKRMRATVVGKLVDDVLQNPSLRDQ